VEAGKILIAPGDFHMKVASGGAGCACVWISRRNRTPAVPRSTRCLLRSAEVYGGAVLAVVLTGMGQDGLRGRRF
jgi:two-component system chemotaxis response regulator CheB